ncbi:MAG: pantetheine-phosphate adenylyltransferase [Metamycoplasmataceae bacterium]
MKKAIYPGSFNPFHEGHMSIIEKALKLFDFIYIVVTLNPDKNETNDFYKNKKIIENIYNKNKKIKVLVNENELTSQLAKKLEVNFLIRSFRSEFDLAYEVDLAFSNNYLNNDLETILFFPNYKTNKISSTIERHINYINERKKEKN